MDELSQRLENYPSNIDKIKKLIDVMNQKFDFQEITDLAVFDLFCYWYDEYKLKGKKGKIRMPSEESKATLPIDEKYVGEFFK